MVQSQPDIIPYLDEQINIRLSRYSFWEFCLYYDEPFFTKRSFLKDVAEGFQKIQAGEILTLSVSMPPRSGKSYITSLFCAWWLGKNPELSVMRNSCTATLYRKFSYDVRMIARSLKYKTVFPGMQFADDKQNLEGWNLKTSKQVGYFGAGVGGTIIGFGANLAISDDLYRNLDDALNENYNDSVIRWKESSHDSRKEKHCPEIYIGTRWSKQDVIGKAIDDGKINVEIKVSALSVNKDGELVSFCEDVKTNEEYIDIKNSIDETIWEAEYQQEPIEVKGLLFPKSSLKYFRPSNVPEPEFKYQAIDPADKGNDDTSGPYCDLIGNGIYIGDVVYNNHGTDVNIPTIVEKAIDKKLNAIEIEGVSAWILFGKDVRTKVNERYGDCDIRIIKNQTNKQVRILAESAFIRNHFYFLHEEYWTPEYRKFMSVLTRYLRAGSAKDDAPDSLAMCSTYFRNNFAHLW